MTAEEVREAEARIEAEHFDARLHSLLAALVRMEKDPTLAAEGKEGQELATWVAYIQDVRQRLSMVEVDLTTALGKRLGKTVGELPDGRQFTLSRAQDRKEWDHEDWKRDARRKVTAVITEKYGDHLSLLVEDGEVVDLALGQVVQEALAIAQEVHGSTAPRSRALKTLGLYATDYCTSTPSGWRLTAVKPTPTTDKDTTDA